MYGRGDDNSSVTAKVRADAAKRIARKLGNNNGRDTSAGAAVALEGGSEAHSDRRLFAFSDARGVDDEQLLIDLTVASKIDTLIRMCMEKDAVAISEDKQPYVEASLRQYAMLLNKRVLLHSGVTDILLVFDAA